MGMLMYDETKVSVSHCYPLALVGACSSNS